MYEERICAALAAALDGPAAEELAVLRTARRHRSCVYFVGVQGDEAPRWVVKRPDSERRQQDLRSPGVAAEQYEALVRLHSHLTRWSTTVSSPRPVGLLRPVEALAMEYAAGRTVADLLRAGALLRPEPLFAGVELAAEALLLIHELAPGGASGTDAWEASVDASAAVRRHLREAGLPCRERWSVAVVRPRTYVEPQDVLLHGDWAPENVIQTGSGVTCLDAELTERGWPEHDVARFLVMLSDAPFFVTATRWPAATQLRRRAALSFLRAYYGEDPASPLLQPLLVAGLAARWATRDRDVLRRNPPGTRSRRLLLRQHFTSLLDEASSPGWPDVLVSGAELSAVHGAPSGRP